MLKIGQFAKPYAHAKAIAHAKWLVWVKNLKCQKHAKTHNTRTLELFCAKKKRSKKKTKYSRNDTFLKFSLVAKATAPGKVKALAKCTFWVQI